MLHRLANFLLAFSSASAAEIQPGVWGAATLESLPLPTTGFQVYFFGELHGAQENEALLLQYLTRLHSATGLHDVALEEDAVYQPAAQAFIDGRLESLPPELCLRAGPLQAIRRFNEQLRPGQPRIRVHLVDIDPPASAIRNHLLALQQAIPNTARIRVPSNARIRTRALQTVTQLERLTTDPQLQSELRTVRHSIHALQQGLEVTTGPPRGSPYLEDREQAIAANIQDILRNPGCRGVFAPYGADHVAKRLRKDGGPKRNLELAPVALRLQQSGLRVFSLVAFPLSGITRWRGVQMELPYTAKDGSLADGQALDQVLQDNPSYSLLFIDLSRHAAKLPSQDITRSRADAFLLYDPATPMINHCPSP